MGEKKIFDHDDSLELRGGEDEARETMLSGGPAEKNFSRPDDKFQVPDGMKVRLYGHQLPLGIRPILAQMKVIGPYEEIYPMAAYDIPLRELHPGVSTSAEAILCLERFIQMGQKKDYARADDRLDALRFVEVDKKRNPKKENTDETGNLGESAERGPGEGEAAAGGDGDPRSPWESNSEGGVRAVLGGSEAVGSGALLFSASSRDGDKIRRGFPDAAFPENGEENPRAIHDWDKTASLRVIERIPLRHSMGKIGVEVTFNIELPRKTEDALQKVERVVLPAIREIIWNLAEAL